MLVYATYLKNVPNISKNNLLFEKLDVTHTDDVQQCIRNILDSHGQLDVVIYCVSGSVRPKRISELTWQNVQSHLDIQVKGLFYTVQSLLPYIREQKPIKFIVISTEYCIGKPPKMLADYVSAKYALEGLTKSFASELGSPTCTFNLVSPGMTVTNLLSELPPKMLEISAQKHPMKRLGETKDVSAVVLFLSSEQSSYMNGANIVVNGGNTFM